MGSIGGSRGALPAHAPPTGSNSFVFTHVFAEKHLRQRSAHPPQWLGALPTEKPGSATGFYQEFIEGT